MTQSTIRPINDDLRIELITWLRANGGDAVNLDGDTTEHLLRRVSQHHGGLHGGASSGGIHVVFDGPFAARYSYESGYVPSMSPTGKPIGLLAIRDMETGELTDRSGGGGDGQQVLAELGFFESAVEARAEARKIWRCTGGR
jgi:hypothetical protein